MSDYTKKSTVDEIRLRFDNDVDRFSNLDTGQISTIDATFCLELITESARRIKPQARTLLDVGAGAGNYTIRMLNKIPSLQCTLLDLSEPMLRRAAERISAYTTLVHLIQGDIRDVALSGNSFDIILAGAVLHHLRDDKDWENVFKKLYAALNRGGCLLVCDMVMQDQPILNSYVWQLYGEYLVHSRDEKYREQVLAYIEKEDSPRSMIFQTDLMKKVGFAEVDILHKHLNFGAFVGIK